MSVETPMVREIKSYRMSHIKADFEAREVSGYAATWDLDQVNDVIEKGAFSRTLKQRGPAAHEEGRNRIKVLWQHDQPIGIPLEMEEDEKGLFIRARISKTVLGDEALTLIRDGVVDRMSIGFDIVRREFDEDTGVRRIKEIKLFEFSFVTFPANERAVILDLKQMDDIADRIYAKVCAKMEAKEIVPPIPVTVVLPDTVEAAEAEVAVEPDAESEKAQDESVDVMATLLGLGISAQMQEMKDTLLEVKEWKDLISPLLTVIEDEEGQKTLSMGPVSPWGVVPLAEEAKDEESVTEEAVTEEPEEKEDETVAEEPEPDSELIEIDIEEFFSTAMEELLSLEPVVEKDTEEDEPLEAATDVVLEVMAEVKAGRTISRRNQVRIEDAIGALQALLDTADIGEPSDNEAAGQLPEVLVVVEEMDPPKGTPSAEGETKSDVDQDPPVMSEDPSIAHSSDEEDWLGADFMSDLLSDLE
jgi:uncharacterized protein